MNRQFSECYKKFNHSHSLGCNCSQYKIDMELLIDTVCSLKSGKCSDDDGINAEHIQHAPFNFLQRLLSLLNGMLRHSCVPNQFRFGNMIPIIKDSQGNFGDVSNYRGITISPIITKVLEHALKGLFSDYLSTSSNQFGFKKGNSTSHAIYCLK